MKIRVNATDFNGKKEVLEREIRDLGHLQAQINHKAQVYKNKKHYERKPKYGVQYE